MLADEKIYEEETPVQKTDIVEESVVEEVPENVEDEVEFNPIGTISSEVAYMRKEPTKSGAINLFLKKGDTVMITADGDAGNYYLVTAQTKVGYVLKNDITVK